MYSSETAPPAPHRVLPGDDAAIVEAVEKIKALHYRSSALSDEVDELPTRIALTQMQATNITGFRAQAWVTRENSNVSGSEYFDPSDDGAVAWSLARDLLACRQRKSLLRLTKPDIGFFRRFATNRHLNR